jgi:2'-5' RNA ligase
LAERWFFALWPDPEVRASLAALGAGLIPPGGRGAHPLDLHLTLRFLGTLDAQALGRAESAADGIRAPAIPLRIDRVGHFSRPRVLWCGPSAPSAELLALAGDLELALIAAGFAPEPRPFAAHLTLARRVGRPVGVTRCAPLDWTARELVLAAGREGQVPRYGIRRRWPLGAAQAPAPVDPNFPVP